MNGIIEVLAKIGLYFFKKWANKQNLNARETQIVYDAYSVFNKRTGYNVELEIGNEKVTDDLIRRKRERERKAKKEWDSK